SSRAPSSGIFATRSPSISTLQLSSPPGRSRNEPVSPAGVPSTSSVIVPWRPPSASGADQDCVSWIVTEDPTKGRTMSGTRSVGIDSSVRTVKAPAGDPSTEAPARAAPSVERRIAVYSGSAYITIAPAADRGRVNVSRSFILVLPGNCCALSLEQSNRPELVSVGRSRSTPPRHLSCLHAEPVQVPRRQPSSLREGGRLAAAPDR